MASQRRSGSDRPLPRLFAPTDPQRGRDPAWLAANLPAGSAIILRHYEWPQAKRLALAQAIIAIARPRHVLVLVARDADLALQARADGFHAPEKLADRILAYRRSQPHGLVTMAAHGWRGLVTAARLNADAVLLSRAFVSKSHQDAPALGPARFAALARQARVPVIALGGISRNNLRRLAFHHGIAVIGRIEDFL